MKVKATITLEGNPIHTYDVEIPDDVFATRYKNATEEDVVWEYVDEVFHEVIEWNFEIIEPRKDGE